MTSQPIVSVVPESATPHERRAHARTAVALHGRICADGGHAMHCTIIDLSPGGACVETRSVPALGEDVVIDVACIGRIAGKVVRADPFDFGMRFTICDEAKKRLASQIMLQFNRERLHTDERRVSERCGQGDGADLVEFADGSSEIAHIKDISLTGVAFLSENRPRIGLELRIGVLTGRVVRHLEDGYAVAFDPPSTPV